MKAQMLALIFTFFINYLANSVCAPSPPYQWNLTNPGKNVKIFAQLIEDVYQQSLQFIDVYVPLEKALGQNDKVSFNFTFVKYASELANFRVIGNNEKIRPTFKAHTGVIYSRDEFVGFRRYSNKLNNFIANEFNKNIFCPEKVIPQKVVGQIMQLIFSYAARILLCLTDDDYYSSNGIGEWQLQTLLSAYKILAERYDNNKNGIFPFPIIQIDANKDHLWAGFMNQNISKNTSKQMQYIENFNFILKLSKFSLSYYDVYKVLEAILLESSAVPSSTINKSHLPTNDEPPLAVHTFFKQYFIAKLDPKSMEQYNVNKVDCAIVNFGRELERRLVEDNSPIRNPGFSQYVKRMEAECGTGPHIKHDYLEPPTENTPSPMSKQLEMELFDEPLWNYARAIQIDSHTCKAVLQFADELSRIVNFKLNSDKKNKYSIDGITKLNEFKLLLNIIERIGDTENYKKLENFETNNSKAEKKHSLNELSKLLKQIIKEYSCTNNSCPLNGHLNLSKYRQILPKFGQILFETFKKYSENVKYDETRQLLSFPSALSEHILGRFFDFLQRLKLTPITEIGNKLDFVETIQNIASMDNIEIIQRKRIPRPANSELFKLLFTLAIRLSSQIEQNDLAEKYLKTFLFAFNQSFEMEKILFGFFALKIRNINKMVEVSLPTWKLPYFIYLENKEELEQEKAFENFEFIHSLSEYSLTMYEIIKMANILGDINDEQIWISPSDPEIFLKVLKYSTGQEKPTKKIKVPIQNKFCVLAYFVEDLLKKAKAKNNFPDVEAVELALNFFLEKQKLCDDKPKHFRDNMLRYANGIKANIDPHKELQQIIPPIIKELKEMLQNGEWMCAKLNTIKKVEWTLLKFDLKRLEKTADWEQIKELRGKWRKLYDDWFRNGGDVPDFAKVMEKMKTNLNVLLSGQV